MPRLPFSPEELRNPRGKPFGHQILVRFQDVDGAAIVFFSRFFEYFHDAFAAFLAQHGLSLAESVRAGEWLSPLIHAEADYESPLKFGDTALVEVVAVRMGRSSMRVGYRIRRFGTDELIAVGQTVHVFVDRASFRPMEIPENVRFAFGKVEEPGC